MNTGRRRYPNTPDCAIVGCTLAARRMGMCAAHASLLPIRISMESAAAAMQASHEAGKVHRERASRLVEGVLAAQRAQHVPP